MSVVGRFAPSPTGRMHLGNIYSALLSYLSAKSKGGEWVLRIEDLDPQRSRMDYALQAEDDLRWLGLEWDRGGTATLASPCPYVQSRRADLYEHYLAVLASASLTYPCFCTRADIMATQAPHESDGRIVYAGTCRPADSPSEPLYRPSSTSSISALRKPSTRLIVPDADISFSDLHYGPQRVNLAQHCGDFIVRRADGAFAYQLAVVVDDALMGITEVVRGRDLLLSSAQQIYLYEKLGFPVPAFCHLPLLINSAGQRLSKRDRSLDMGAIRARFTPEQLLGILAHAAGQTPTPMPISLAELLPCFSWEKVPTADVCLEL